MNTVLVEINPQTAFILTIFHAVPSETVNNLRMISRRLFCRDTNAAESDQSGELRRQNSVSQYLIARNSLRRSSTSPIISYLGICPMLPSRRNYSAIDSHHPDATSWRPFGTNKVPNCWPCADMSADFRSIAPFPSPLCNALCRVVLVHQLLAM
jgi:hypothetical protein